MTIAVILGRILGIAGDELAKLIAYFEALAQQYPDASTLEQKIAAFLLDKYGAVFANLPNLLKSVALDLASGLTGSDPDAWKGSV
jgi:hypothetical protein